MLSFEQQKELLQMQLDNSKVLHQLQFERLRFTEENERARRSLEHQKLELESQRLDLIRQGKITSPGAAATRAAADAVQLKSPDDKVLDKVENTYQEKGF
ncbi:unnamed protein product [Arctogadus glacialis]